MTQPTVYIVIGGDAAVEPSAIALEEGIGEILETVEWTTEGKPDWTNAGICDERGTSRQALIMLREALEFAEANAREVGFEVVRVPKSR